MFRAFEKSEQPCKFSPDAVTDFGQFLKELSGYLHHVSKAVASAVVKLEVDETGGSKLAWTGFLGDDSSQFQPLVSRKLIDDCIGKALEVGAETCLIHDPKGGLVRRFPPQEKNGSAAPALVAAEDSKVRVARSTEAEQIEVVIKDGSSANKLAQENPYRTGVSFGPPTYSSLLWVRPLSNRHVLLSICPPEAHGKTLRHVIQSAHDSRKLVIDRVKAEEQNQDNRKVLRLAEEVSSQLPLNEQAFLQANEIRRYLDCDRVTIFEVNNASARAMAVSGQPKFNRRSNSIRTGENMVGRIVKTGEAFWFSGNFEELADSLQDSVRSYTDESLVNSFVLFPLVKTDAPVYPSEEEAMLEAINPGSASQRKTIGAVLVEQIEDVVDRPVIEDRWQKIQRLVLNQFNNSRSYDSIFLVRLWTMLGRFAAFYRGQTKRKAIAITSALGILLLGALVIPADFRIRCEGYLVFDNTMEMYSMNNGNVVELNVFDGKSVVKGDVLLVQENHEVEMECARISGEIAQKEAEIRELNYSRAQSHFTGDSDQASDSGGLAQGVAKLEVELAELVMQRELLENELRQLKILAPFTGTIAGWKTERRLLGRPLEKGTHLFSLIPSKGAFKLDLRVPDQRAGYVQNAWVEAQKNEEPLPVVFRLASAPGEDRRAEVNFVSPGLERDQNIGYTLPIRAVATDEIPKSERKSRTAVVAKVICGRRSFAYCKSYEALDWIRSKFFELGF